VELKEMQMGMQYTVTKGGGPFQVGDSIELGHDDQIMSLQLSGWVDREKWAHLHPKVEVEINHVYYKGRKAYLEDSLKKVNEILTGKRTAWSGVK